MKIFKGQIIKYLFYIIPLTLTIIFLILFINVKTELEQIKDDYAKANKNNSKEKEELILENKRLKSLVRDTKIISSNSIYLYDHDIRNMKAKGLTNPVQDIISDLRKHRELIPYKGSLGGTMDFYGNNTIWILTNKWVLAYFEDGHSGGYLLLEYKISNNGIIEWKGIASMVS